MDCAESDIMFSLLTLRNEKTGEFYDILRKRTHLVARSGFKGDLEIPGDMSISRSHAEIIITKKAVGSKVKVCLKVIDKKSKFGTFINDGISQNKQIESDRLIILELGDRIRFGAIDSIWTVEKYSVIACPSTLKLADKEILKKSVTKIGGRVTRDWSDQCTHLCMNNITVTEKALLCLASAKSIVPLRYFIDLYKALLPDSLTEIPFCMDYRPELVESLLNPDLVSLYVNNNRKTLFSGKTFICSTAGQLNRISKIVKAAGGKVMNFFDGTICEDDILNCKEYIVMQQDPYGTEDKDRYQIILDQLKVMNKRPIPENDIGLAIIFSSTVNHCNPNYNVSLVNLKSQPNITESQASIVLAPETEMLSVDNSEICSVNVVPDSLPQTQARVKRPIEVVMDSNEFEQPKKRAVLSNDEGKNHNVKIRAGKENLETFNNVIEPNPSKNNHLHQPPESQKTTVYVSSTNVDSNLTTVPSSQEICNQKQFSAWLQPIIADKNVNITNNFDTDDNKTTSKINNMPPRISSNMTTMPCFQEISNKNDFSAWLQPTIAADNNVNGTNNFHSLNDDGKTITKRKMSRGDSMFEDDDPFGYSDFDESEEHTKKKPKKETESLFLPMFVTTSGNKSKYSKSVESITNKAVDPNFIMNLLSTAKGAGQFIDASKPVDKSCTDVSIDSKDNDLLNSVIVETINMVVSKPIQSQNVVEQSHTKLKNFKKFKRKGPAMRIPHIVPLDLSPVN